MEFDFNCEEILSTDKNGFILIKPVFQFENPLVQYCINIVIDKISSLPKSLK